MATFTLVHGSGQNSRSWSLVREILESRGHTVVTPDLPKKGPGWRIADYAAAIADAVPGPETVVAAHSQCGIFLPLVPGIRPCSRLVFVAAVIPEPGKSIRDQAIEDPSMFSQAWINAGKRWFDKAHEESLSREFMFHDCDEERVSWALGTVELLDTYHLAAEPSPFTRWPDVPMHSVVATEDRTLTPDWGRRITRRVLGTEPIEVRAGHCPHVSRPEEIAGILERLAENG